MCGKSKWKDSRSLHVVESGCALYCSVYYVWFKGTPLWSTKGSITVISLITFGCAKKKYQLKLLFPMKKMCDYLCCCGSDDIRKKRESKVSPELIGSGTNVSVN